MTWTTGWTGSRPPGSSSESQSELCTLALIDALFAPCPATCSLHSGTFSVFAYLKRTARHSVCSTAPAVSCPATRPTPSQLHFSHFARVLFVKRVSRSLLPDCTIAMCAAPAPSPAVGAWTSVGDAPCWLRARSAVGGRLRRRRRRCRCGCRVLRGQAGETCSCLSQRTRRSYSDRLQLPAEPALVDYHSNLAQ